MLKLVLLSEPGLLREHLSRTHALWMSEHRLIKCNLCRGCMNLCCGRWCGLWTGPLKRYAEAFAAQRIIPDLAITNHMNHEAILQVLEQCKRAREMLMQCYDPIAVLS